jgi:hypothetical protein
MNPHEFGWLDLIPDPGGTKMTRKSEEMLCFEVLDVFFKG